MKQLIAILLLLLPLSAGAATYSWTDEAGTVHFTDDPGSIPAKLRKKNLRYDSEPAPPSLAPPGQAENDKKALPTAPPSTPPATAQPAAPAQTTVEKSTKFGERTAEQWQTMFRALREQLKGIDQQIEQLKREGGDGKTMLTRQKIDELNTRNKQLLEEHETLRLRFNRLVEEANAVGLPPEFGQ